MAEYLHPSVSSRIVDNSVTFVTAQGVTQLLVAFTADRGPEGLKLITSPEEWLFHYGEPNMRRHGQPAYNAMNWLNAGGGVYALRVVPGDAGYAHAILNVQTKESTKKVKNAQGDLVDFRDVTVRTVATYTGVANTSLDALENEMKRGRPNTVDGFKNHLLMAVVPRGRGKAYNDLGFRLTPTDAFDETYGFRVYEFETVRRMENGALQTLEGPFHVSLSPEAISRSNESMFIGHVLETYSQYLNVIFNENAYDELGAVINPHVNPDVLDFLTLQTRELGGSKETYFDETLGMDVDVHIAVHAYDSSGSPVGGSEPVINMVDPDDTVEASIVSVDNSTRGSDLRVAQNTVRNMKLALSYVRNNSYATRTNVIYNDVDETGTLVDAETDLESAVAALDDAKTAYDGSEQAQDVLEDAIAALRSSVNSAVTEARTALDLARALGDTATTTQAVAQLNAAVLALSGNEAVRLKSAQNLGLVAQADADLSTAEMGSNAEKLAGVSNAIDVANSVMHFAIAVANESLNFADGALSIASADLADAVNSYLAATDKNQLDEEVAGNVKAAVEAAYRALDSVDKARELATVEANYSAVLNASLAVLGAVNEVKVALKEARTLADGDQATVEDVVSKAIEVAESAEFNARSNTYTSVLHNFNNPLVFREGSDGSLDENHPDRERVRTSLLAQAYRGLIDQSLTDKKKWPIDLVLDANYPIEVKNAIVELCTQIRKDFIGIMDTGFVATPQQALDFRTNQFQVSSFYMSLFTQDFVVYDDFTGQDIKVTPTFFLAGKIPTNDEQYGIHYPFVGPRRGTISGFKAMSFNPSPPWREQLYKKQINYVVQDNRRTAFDSQLTTQTVVSALSNINNVRTLLRIQRDVENLAEDYKFEFANADTERQFQYNLDAYLARWITNGACQSISGQVYASDYDRIQKLMRVKIEMVFTDIIERVLIDLVVNR